jgi:two-component system OmpR family response regulator
MSKILLVEDDPVLGKSVQLTLELEKYTVTWVRDLRSALKTNETNKFDIVILDLGLPDGSGLDFCKKVREIGSRIPILILTAQTHEDSVVEGFNAGANDYVEKPFKPKVLIARVKNGLREPTKRDQQLRCGDLLVIENQRKVFCGENEIELNRREFDILNYLIGQADSVVTREAMATALDRDGEIFDRTIDSHVSRLRASLKKGGVKFVKITSVYGVGYRLENKMTDA